MSELTSTGAEKCSRVVARVRLVDVRRPVAVVQRPRHVDAVLERAADVVVDGHVLLVEQAAAGAGGVVELGDRPAGEVPRRAVVAGRAEDVERARLVRVRRDARAAVEHLAAEVRVALRVPGDRRVASGLPVLARLAAEVGAARESHRDRRVVPVLPAVERVRAVAVAVAAAVVVLARDHVVLVVRVDRDRGLVLGLAAAGEIGIGDVQAVLVHLDVVAAVLGARVLSGRLVVLRRRRRLRRPARSCPAGRRRRPRRPPRPGRSCRTPPPRRARGRSPPALLEPSAAASAPETCAFCTGFSDA